MWPTLKQKNGKFSIGRHASLYKIYTALVTYIRGHSNDMWSPFWLLGFHECGKWEFIKMRACWEKGMTISHYRWRLYESVYVYVVGAHTWNTLS